MYLEIFYLYLFEGFPTSCPNGVAGAVPDNLKITPDKNGMVIVETEERYETPKYEGVFYNQLTNGDKTFYIIYTDIKTSKKINLKIGKESQGYTETFCVNKRKEVLEKLRLGENQVKIKNKRVYSEILTLDKVAEKYHENRKLYLTLFTRIHLATHTHKHLAS